MLKMHLLQVNKGICKSLTENGVYWNTYHIIWKISTGWVKRLPSECLSVNAIFNTMRHEKWTTVPRRHLNAFSWMKFIVFWTKFHWSWFMSIHLKISHCRFGWWPGIKPQCVNSSGPSDMCVGKLTIFGSDNDWSATSHYLNQCSLIVN